MQTSDPRDAWHALHPAMLLFGIMDRLRTLIVPVLFVTILNPASNSALFWLTLAIVTSLVPLAARYASLRYATIDGSICIREGVFSSRVRRIPAKRIHNLNVRQHLIARLLNVVQLEIETAGGGAAEASLVALSKTESDRLFAYWRSVKAGGQTLAVEEDEAESPPFYHINNRDIFVAGATTHRLGIIFVAMAGLFQLFEERFLNAFVGQGPEMLQQAAGRLSSLRDQAWWQVLLLAAATLLVLLFIAWLLSIVTAYIRWYQFTIRHAHDSISIRTGLFTVRQYNFPLNKVQALRCRITPLRRPWGLMQIFVQSAGHLGFQDGGQTESDLLVPITRVRKTQHFVNAVWPDARWDDLTWHPVHVYTRTRQFRVLLALAALLIAGLLLVYGVETWTLAAAGLFTAAVLPGSWLTAHATWRQTAYAFDQRFVYIKTGFLGLYYWVIPLNKIQNAAVHQNPFQFVRRLASLQLDVAGGGGGEIVIPNIAVSEAWLLFNRFINPRPRPIDPDAA